MASKKKSLQSSIDFQANCSKMKCDDVSRSDWRTPPGLLDLHSFDTELLPQMPVSNRYDDSDLFVSTNRYTNETQDYSDNSLLKSFSADKEKSKNVAKIKVVVRKRPLNEKEISKKEPDIITVESNSNCLTVHETKLKVDLTEYVEKHEFSFDAVLNENVTNHEVYFETVEPIVPLIFQRTKATCFAYGQTGSGKTYTMQPLPLRASQDILRLMLQTYRNQGFHLCLSFFEIYGGKLFDLLNDRKKLFMREDGKQQVCIVGLQEYTVTDLEMIKELIEKGNATRSTGVTGANEESSRSHAILQLAIKRSSDSSDSKPARLVGKLSFIDLAGSERGADTTDNDKQTRIEGAEINKSLLALKECIRALDNDQNHIPFRGSKLTEVLRDSFVGDSRTVMISCISPSSGSCEHTLNTLRYADRVKSLSKGSKTVNMNEKNRYGWPNQIDSHIDTCPPLNIDRVPTGKAEGYSVASSKINYIGQKYVQKIRAQDEFDQPEKTHKQEKTLLISTKGTDALRNPALEDKRKTDTEIKWRNPPNINTNNTEADDDLIALLKEEEDLLNAHQKQVEETVNIIKEEMNLLAEANQPGNQLDDYISKLNAILSEKAAGIVQLQARLAHFQQHLDEHSVLLSTIN